MEVPDYEMEVEQPQTEDKKPKRRNKTKDKIVNYIKRSCGGDTREVYEDILEENNKLRNDLDKTRAQLMLIQKEYEEVRQGILDQRLVNLN